VDSDITGIPFVAFDPDFANNDAFYATQYEEAGVYRRTDEWNDIGGKNTWVDDADVGGPASDDPISGYNIVVGPDGVLYCVDWTNDGVGVSRSVNPTASSPYFEPINDEWPDGYAWGLWMTPGSNMLWTIHLEKAEIYTYTDVITTPSLSSPSDGSSSERIDEVTIRWNAVAGADDYVVFFSWEPDFDTRDVFITGDTSVRVTGLEDGQTYYWKVAVMAEEPVLSLWSDIWEFTTALSAAEWNPFIGGVPEAPYNGATNVPLVPTFAWNGADWSTGYEFVLAKDSIWSDVVVAKTGANALSATVYECEQQLDNSTTYYWKVRAVSKTSQSDWATGVFTTEGKAPSPPPSPTPTPPPPTPEPVTPMYIWVIIGVGAALVIAVIILIIRTRARV